MPGFFDKWCDIALRYEVQAVRGCENMITAAALGNVTCTHVV